MGWPTEISDEEALAKLLELNLSRAAAMPSKMPDEATEAQNANDRG
jgi:hypothetical protein